MSGLNALFRKRIGFADDEPIPFESLDRVLEKTAQTIPFENFRIIENNLREITKENLIRNMLVNEEGGLCYELNSLLCFFLLENGFQAELTRGVVYRKESQQYLTIGRTHVTILLTHEGRTYLVDTGFGGNLPLKPVPLTGETVTSGNGQFRIKPVTSEHGDSILEMKLKHKDTDWRIGYAFDSKKRVADISEFNEIQTIISEHQESPFNKQHLITKLTDEGSATLTNHSFTQWADGVMTKEQIDNARYKQLLKQHFGR